MLKQVKQLSKNTSWALDLLMLTLFVGLFYIIFLGKAPLAAPDEARYSEIPREMLESGDFITPHLNAIKYFEKPPLFYWMQTVSIKLFGLSETSLRFTTMLMGILGCLITYATTRVLFNRNLGLLSALMLATSFLYYGLSHLITLDMTFGVFITGTLFSFLLAVNTNKRMERFYFTWLSALCCALAVLTKGFAGILLPGLVIFFWLLLFKEWRQLKILPIFSAAFLFLLVVLPWHILVQQKNPEFFHYYVILQQFSRYLTLSADRYQPNWFFIPIVLAGLLPWTLFLFQALRYHYAALKTQWQAHKNMGFLLLWAFLIFIFFSLSHSKLIPYIIPIFPPLAIIIASYCQVKKSNRLLCGMILMSACIFPFANFVRPHVGDPSIKALALVLTEKLQPTDTVVCFKHYYQDLPFYLQRDVIVANWKNELEFGAAHQKDGKNRLISTDQFIALLQSSKTVYAMTTLHHYEALITTYPHLLTYTVVRDKNNIIITNKEPRT